METKKHILTTKNLSIGYEKKQLAQDVCLQLETGKLIAVIGKNGEGKSTFLKTIMREISALSGKIYLESKNLDDYDVKDLATQMAIVLTKTSFSKNLSVFEFIAFARQPYTNWIGKLTPTDQQKIEEAISLLEIEDIVQKHLFELSDGQLQKTQLARAVAQDTPIILLDEPTSHLDIYHKAFVFKLLKKLTSKFNKTIVFATHEIELALQICDQILLVDHQKIEAFSPENLIASHQLETLFPKNFVVFDPVEKRFKIQPE
ncbi:ABC transporter ATP-binding protein [Mesonia sp. K7]|uniref:ABC transporter ATP-binding protein n=1 Tax=Mesonia sp. K7 TaxID=2218606 RepID=UPI000DA8CAB1|nr:ABC transporter ATP-binding protein [Mesonia sp. K7]PZD77884.1 ABC transporter ATP-binding protein [Mesonia sp. K7]